MFVYVCVACKLSFIKLATTFRLSHPSTFAAVQTDKEWREMTFLVAISQFTIQARSYFCSILLLLLFLQTRVHDSCRTKANNIDFYILHHVLYFYWNGSIKRIRTKSACCNILCICIWAAQVLYNACNFRSSYEYVTEFMKQLSFLKGKKCQQCKWLWRGHVLFVG